MSVSLGPQVRRLKADALGIGYEDSAAGLRPASAPDAPIVRTDNPEVMEVVDLLSDYSGVLLSGPPGTSKSYLASAVARVMTDWHLDRTAFCQFHPSYQFEDFIEGYRPVAGQGFARREGILLALCSKALHDPDNSYVLVIDELSRGDAARVFGEALTYIERSKRMMPFILPSGVEARIPLNVHIIATMNPLDRGVDEVDAAFERRFAKKVMEPDGDVLAARLEENGVTPMLRDGIIRWFKNINGQARSNPAAALGHAYFWDVTDADTLEAAWKYQIQHHVARAFRYDDRARESLTTAWSQIVTEPSTIEE